MDGGKGVGVDLYLLAGVKTWPSYFREPAERLKAMSIEAGYADPEVHVLYPYGDHTIPLLRQVRQVARDVMRRLAVAADPLHLAVNPPETHRGGDAGLSPFSESEASNAAHPRSAATMHEAVPSPDAAKTHDAASPFIAESPGSAASSHGAAKTHDARLPNAASTTHAAATPSRDATASRLEARMEQIVGAIRERSAGRVVVLIGHSGGGVAACHAGRRLLAEGVVHDVRIVQVGSPKVRIHPALRDRTAYFYAVDERGRSRDPITRLGTWGGIRKAASGIPLWDPRRWAPGHVAPITIDGGHKDYFACGSSGISGTSDRATNLERTAAAVLEWLVRSLHPACLVQARQAEPERHPSPFRSPASSGQPSPT